MIKIKCRGSSRAKLEDLFPFQGNLKELPTENYVRLKEQILKHGFTSPFHCWSSKKGEDKQLDLLDGHQRHKALGMMSAEGIKIPCEFPIVEIEAPNIKAAKDILLGITSQYGKISKEGLGDYLKEADIDFSDAEMSFDFDAFGINELVEENEEPYEGLTGDDETPDVTENPVTKRGDVWILGDHRVMCGDSTVIDEVEKLMNGEKADMVFTDPPYGVDYTGGHNEKQRSGIKNDKLSGEDLTGLFEDSISNATVITTNKAAFYIWFAGGKSVETFASFANLDLKIRAIICWYKINSGLGAFMSQYIPNYEPCIYALKNKGTVKWNGPTNEKTVWELKKESVNKLHPTQKPVDLSSRAIINSSDKGDIVYDCFLGSGSTLIGAEKTKRKCYGMELDERYCDIIIKRWQNYTGKIAVLESTGEEFKR